MFTMTLDEWAKYRDLLKKLSDKAAEEFRDAVFSESGRWHGIGLANIPRDELISFTYALVTKYSEGAATAACEMYDAIAELSGVALPPAEPAPTASIDEVAKTVYGTANTNNEEIIANSIGRLVKRAGQDTTLRNAQRDGAYAAWIPSGDTCAFCITLASRGWELVRNTDFKDGHAKHIHSNCDCAYAVKFNDEVKYSNYDPSKYEEMYYGAPLEKGQRITAKNRVNALRREIYAQNKEEINAQKRSAYEKRKERESSEAEEADVN